MSYCATPYCSSMLRAPMRISGARLVPRIFAMSVAQAGGKLRDCEWKGVRLPLKQAAYLPPRLTPAAFIVAKPELNSISCESRLN